MQPDYVLTKSRITTGLKCPQKLWFDVNDRIRKDSYLFHLGNRFGDFARSHYGEGYDLTGNLDAPDALAKTEAAISDPKIGIIYEAAFLFNKTLVRTDVLIRKGAHWEMVEVKSSSGVKNDHIIDATLQTYIVKNSGLDLTKIKIAHINADFIYEGREKYEGLLAEVDITTDVNTAIPNAKTWIKQLLPIAEKGSLPPLTPMGEQCGSGSSACLYKNKCEKFLGEPPEVPISILPYVGKRMSEIWAKEGIYDLRDLPLEVLSKPIQKIIQQAHRDGKDWISVELREQIRHFSWPRFFMDFETVQQGVPLIEKTKPREAVPFQWSVHKWESPDHELNIEQNFGFLKYTGVNLERQFLLELIEVLGDHGPIFAHRADTERKVLKDIVEKESCQDLRPTVDAILKRVICTLDMVREGFYSPKMKGSYSLKDIVKAIPNSVAYSSDDLEMQKSEVANGGDAMIAWFKCTDPSTSREDVNRISENLDEYCSKDTFALYQLFKFINP